MKKTAITCYFERFSWRMDLLVLLVLSSVALFVSLGQNYHWSSREIRHAEIIREMMQSGHYFKPTLLGMMYVDKPPLPHWVGLGVAKVTGHASLFSARFPSALAGVMGVLATYGLGLLLMSRAVALLGALALLSIPNYFNMAREARPDAFLVAAILLSCLFLTLAVRSQVLIRKSGLFFVAGIFTGIGLVTKGPYGILFPLFFLFLAGLRKASWKSLGWSFGTYVIGALAASLAWAIPAYLQDHGIYLHRVLTQKALMTGVSGHYRPFYWYLGALAFTSLPLSLFVPLGIKRWREDGFSPMLAVALSILVVISFVPGKRNHYLLPMLPFFALGLADAIVRYAPTMLWIKRGAQILIPFAIVGLFSYFTIFLPLASPEGDIEYRLGKHASEILSPTDVLVCGRSIDEELAWVLGGIERVRSVENPKAAADMLFSLTNQTYWAGAPKELVELEKYVPESSLKKKYSVDEGKNKELVLYQFDPPSAIQSK